MIFDPSWILYEDNHLLVVTKLPGILSQEDKSGDPDILTLAKAYIKARDSKPGQVFMGLVHRLDRNTGGVLCLAKTSKAASRLSAQIREGRWEKAYLALTGVRDKERPEGTWERWEDVLAKDEALNMSRSLKPGQRGGKASREQGKKAVSETRLLGTGIWRQNPLALREVKLESGRSHQIRVQAAARGIPLLGDVKYGAKGYRGSYGPFLGLWAWRLCLDHPVKGGRLSFVSLPEGFEAWALFASLIEETRAEANAETRDIAELGEELTEI